MAVTSKDVARLAGVSQPTVSRALRDDPRVSDATKRSVREAADLLGYVPSDAGRALSSGRTHRIGLLVTDLENQFYAQIIAPVHLELERMGYQLMLHTETADNETVAERLIANGLDGVILATTTVDSVAPLRLRDRGLPFVYFNRTAVVRRRGRHRRRAGARGSPRPPRVPSPWDTGASAPSSGRATPAPRSPARSRSGRRSRSTVSRWTRSTCGAVRSTRTRATRRRHRSSPCPPRRP